MNCVVDREGSDIHAALQKDWKYDPDDNTSHVSRAGLALLPEGIEWRVRNNHSVLKLIIGNS